LGDGKALAHSYRTLQYWNQWLSQQFLGKSLLNVESQLLSSLLNNHFGKHALLIGVPNQCDLLNTSVIPYHLHVSPFAKTEGGPGQIEADFHELPIATGSVDLVLLPHTLEFVDNPRQLLAEACRITKAEGLIVICGFNPYSAWGMKRLLTKEKVAPWTGNFFHANKIKNWLELADFELEIQKQTLFIPPINQPNIYHKLHFLERVGRVCFPALGGGYILLARAKVTPLTPIRLKWKQKLADIRMSTTIPGHIARQAEQR
jgi:SAM-dependent methyltransferase